ncbi:MAG: hypothetical protein SR1Q5_03315 [Quinella sp. 1Q5]|nr:hypothetical protein [Quinella sp. 1Q5]
MYIDKMNAWYAMSAGQPQHVIAVMWLFLCLDNVHRKRGWFKIADEQIRDRITDLSKKDVTDAKRVLKELGAIDFETDPKAPRRGTRYVITLGVKQGQNEGKTRVKPADESLHHAAFSTPKNIEIELEKEKEVKEKESVSEKEDPKLAKYMKMILSGKKPTEKPLAKEATLRTTDASTSPPMTSAPVEEALSEAMSEPPVEDALSEAISEPPVEDALSEAMSEPPVEDALSEAISEPPVEEALSEAMSEPPVEEALSEAMSEPPVEDALSEAMSEPPVEEALSEAMSEPPITAEAVQSLMTESESLALIEDETFMTVDEAIFEELKPTAAETPFRIEPSQTVAAPDRRENEVARTRSPEGGIKNADNAECSGVEGSSSGEVSAGSDAGLLDVWLRRRAG